MPPQSARRSIEAQYRRVGMLIGQARQIGFDVAALQARADLALTYNSPGRRSEASRILSEVEMAVPRKKVQYIPLYDRASDDMMTDDDTPPARPARIPKTEKKDSAKKKGKPRR
jgi:hypothetical protein